MNLTDDHIDTVTGWINTGTWAESRGYFHDHASQLLADTTPTALNELALTAPDDLISFYRGLLNTIREHGLEAAYRPLLLTETFGEWIATPGWDASRTFLHDHPELLGEDVSGILASLDGRDPAITIHQAALTLATTPAGVDGAYRSLQDEPSLQATVSAAIASRDAAQIEACARIETLVHERAFTGALHMVLAWLLANPASQLPDGLASQLAALAAQADPAEKDTALAQLDAALASIQADTDLPAKLRQILGLPDGT